MEKKQLEKVFLNLDLKLKINLEQDLRLQWHNENNPQDVRSGSKELLEVIENVLDMEYKYNPEKFKAKIRGA